MHSLKIQTVCVFGALLDKSSMNPTFTPGSKPHTLYILRHCTDIVYVYRGARMAQCVR